MVNSGKQLILTLLIQILALGTPSFAQLAAVGEDNALYVVSTKEDSAPIVKKTDLHGQPDPTFGKDGRVALPQLDWQQVHIAAIRATRDGHVYLLGNGVDDLEEEVEGPAEVINTHFVVRLLPHGQPDPRFGRQGVLALETTDYGSDQPQGFDIAADGSLVIAALLMEPKRDFQNSRSITIWTLREGSPLQRSVVPWGDISVDMQEMEVTGVRCTSSGKTLLGGVAYLAAPFRAGVFEPHPFVVSFEGNQKPVRITPPIVNAYPDIKPDGPPEFMAEIPRVTLVPVSENILIQAEELLGENMSLFKRLATQTLREFTGFERELPGRLADSLDDRSSVHVLSNGTIASTLWSSDGQTLNVVGLSPTGSVRFSSSCAGILAGL